MTAVTHESVLPTFESRLDRIAAAEQGDGWLSDCRQAGRFILPCRQFVVSLAEVFRSLDSAPVLEVCAGRGELAEALASEGVPIVATDASAGGATVRRISARDALRRYRPSVVLGGFVPLDAGVDEAVMAFPSVGHYVVLGARVGEMMSSAVLWRNLGWTAEPLRSVSRWMLTCHDVWVGAPWQPILQHGEAWHFRRKADRSILRR